MGVLIGAPLSDLLTFQAVNNWGKFFLSRMLFLLDYYFIQMVILDINRYEGQIIPLPPKLSILMFGIVFDLIGILLGPIDCFQSYCFLSYISSDFYLDSKILYLFT